MTDDVIADDGSIADIPWASVFDPDHNVRAFNAIQERGFLAASAVIERLVGAANRASADSDQRSEPTPVEVAHDGDVQRAVSAWQSMLAQVVGAPRGGGATPSGAVVVDLAGDGQGQVAQLESVPGQEVSVEIWLHNGAATDLEPISLRCSDLLSHDGEVIASSAVHLDPQQLTMPRRSSRGVLVAIDVAAGVRPGRYRGTLLADGHPDVWLPVVVTVASASA